VAASSSGNGNGIVLINPVFQAFRKQRARSMPSTKRFIDSSQRKNHRCKNHMKLAVFTLPGTESRPPYRRSTSKRNRAPPPRAHESAHQKWLTRILHLARAGTKRLPRIGAGERCERQGDAERFGSVSLFLQCQPQAAYGFFGSRLMGPAVGLLVLSLN
jgi:hypothetical protein